MRTLLHRLVDVRPHEVRGLVWSFAYFLALLTAYSILKPVRDEMAIAGDTRHLQWLFTATFVGTLVAVPVFSAVAGRFPRRRFVPWIYRFVAVTLLAFFALWRADVAPVWIARAFFVWVSVFNLFITSVFWAFLADVFDSDQAKRLFGFVAAGGTIGAMTGPLLAATLAPLTGPVLLLPLSALLFEGAARAAGRVARWAGESPTHDDRPIGGRPLAGLPLLVRSPYLLAIALQTLLFAITSTILYAQYLSLVEAAVGDPAARTALFGWVELGTNALALALQLAVSGRILEKAGLAVSLALQPLLTAAGFVGLGLAPFLGVAVALFGLRRSVHYAVERPAREVLFTSVGREARYKSKSFIDTVVYRGGDAVSGWINAAFRALGLGAGGAAAAAIPFALVGIVLAVFLARTHERTTPEEDR
jgi:AAA family ATP:ADP antiporter